MNTQKKMQQPLSIPSKCVFNNMKMHLLGMDTTKNCPVRRKKNLRSRCPLLVNAFHVYEHAFIRYGNGAKSMSNRCGHGEKNTVETVSTHDKWVLALVKTHLPFGGRNIAGRRRRRRYVQPNWARTIRIILKVTYLVCKHQKDFPGNWENRKFWAFYSDRAKLEVSRNRLALGNFRRDRSLSRKRLSTWTTSLQSAILMKFPTFQTSSNIQKNTQLLPEPIVVGNSIRMGL